MRNRTAIVLMLIVSIACASVSAQAGVNRFTSVSPEGTMISSLVIDPSSPSTIYAGTLAGVFKSIDAGETWTLSVDSTTTLPDGSLMERTIGILAIDPIRPSIVYAGTQTGEVMRTRDGGATWSLLPGIRERAAMIQLVVDPVSPDTLYALTSKALLQSEDGGISWGYRAEGLVPSNHYFPFLSLAIDPSRPSRLYLGTVVGLYVTEDRGKQWTLLLGRPPVYRTVVDPSDSNNIYAALGSALASSNDLGKTWTYLTVRFVTDIVVDPSSSDVYANVSGAVTEILVTVDHGRTWKPLSTSLPDARVLAIDPVEKRSFYAVSRGNLFKSENGGANWRRIKGFTAAAVWDVLVDHSEPSTLFAATAESGVVKSWDSGKNWSDSKLSYKYAQLAIDPRYSSPLFAFTQTATARSVDGGESWTAVNPGNRVTGIAVDPSDSAVVYAVLADGLARSTDGGENWAAILAQLPLGYYGFEGTSIAIDPAVPTTIYAAGNGGIVKSTDSGGTWRTVFKDLTDWYGSNFQDLVIDPGMPSTLYAISNAKVFRSENAGQDWHLVYFRSQPADTPYNERIFFRDLAIDPVETSRLYLATNVGLLRSVGRGEHWSEYNEGLPTRSVNAVTVDPLGNVYAATPRGLFVNSPNERPPAASSHSVSFQTHSGNFVSAKDCGGSFLDANAATSGRCETFELFDLNEGQLNDGDTILLRAASGAFVVAEGGGSADGSPAPVNANRALPGIWESFVVQRVGGGGPIRSGDSISLRSWSGSFVAAEYGGSNGCQCNSRLNANRSRVGIWETFVILVH